MTEYSDLPTDAGVLAELAYQAQSAEAIDPDDNQVFITVGPDGRAHTVDVSHWRTAPRRTVADRTFADVDSLLAYLQRHDPLILDLDSEGLTSLGYPPRFSGGMEAADPDNRPVTLWADERALTVKAVLDDATADRPGWSEHTAALVLERDADWSAWKARNGVLMGQEQAAEFIEDLAHTVVDPDAADLLEIVSTLQVHRQMVVGQTLRLKSGETQINYSTEDTASAGRGATASLTVPNQITLRMPVFLGAEPVEVTARFRYRQQGQALKVAYVINQLRQVEQDAFAQVVREITAAGRPVYFGAP